MKEQTRYRLTGAVFLLALASIVLPMVFDGSGVRVQQVQPIDVDLPRLPSAAELDALRINEQETKAAQAEIAAAKARFDDDGYAVADGTRLGDPELRDPSAPVAETTVGPESAAGSGEIAPAIVAVPARANDWAVQLASFSDPANAQAFRDRLNEDGHQAWLSSSKQNGTLRTRVAIGPLENKASAERLVTQVSARYDVEAIIVEMSP